MSLDAPPAAASRPGAPPLFRILGPVEVTLPGGQPVALPQRLHRAALTALLLHPAQFCSRDWLITTIWQAPPRSGATALRTTIYGLRQKLGALGDRIQTQQAGPQPGGYVIEAATSEVDLLMARALAGAGRAAWYDDDAPAAAQALSASVRLWRGHPLADLPPTPAREAELARLRQEHADTVDMWIDARLELGDCDEVVKELRQILAGDPRRERAWAQLMLALYRSGDATGALDAYASARAALAHEYGSEPGPELAHLRKQMMASAPSV